MPAMQARLRSTDPLAAPKPTGVPAVTLRRPAWSGSKWIPGVPDPKPVLISLHPLCRMHLFCGDCSLGIAESCISLAPHLAPGLSAVHVILWITMWWHVPSCQSHCTDTDCLHVITRGIVGPPSCETSLLYRWGHWAMDQVSLHAGALAVLCLQVQRANNYEVPDARHFPCTLHTL